MKTLKTLYAPTRNQEAIDKMVTDYLPLVKYIVGRLPVRLQPFMDEDDLFNVGVMGLINAARSFDPAVGASFKTYAYTHIKGMILDELRRHDIVPRSARDRAKKVEAAVDKLMVSLGRAPTPEEIARETGLTLKAIEEFFLASRTSALISLSDLDARVAESGGPADALSDAGSKDPSVEAEKAELKELLVEAIRKLPETERQVIYLYYNRNLLLKEIGAVLEVSESRICQILSRAHYLLNKEMQHSGG